MNNFISNVSKLRDPIAAEQIIQRCVYEELFIRYLGKPFREDDNNIYFPCPLCGLSEDSFLVSKTRNYFHCSFCCVGGNSINFVKKMKFLNSQDFKKIVLWIKMLLNEYEENITSSEKQNFDLKCLKFNFALFIDYIFFSNKNKPVFLSKTDIETLETKLIDIGYSLRKLSDLNLSHMAEKYIMLIVDGFNIKDIMAYDKEKNICYSILYNRHSEEELKSIKKTIKRQIS